MVVKEGCASNWNLLKLDENYGPNSQRFIIFNQLII